MENQFFKEQLKSSVREYLQLDDQIKMLNKEDYINKATVKNMHEFENPYLVNYFLTSLPRLFLETLLVFGLTLITLLLIGLNQSLLSIFPTLTLLVVAALRLIPSFNGISSALANIKNYRPSYKLVYSDLLNGLKEKDEIKQVLKKMENMKNNSSGPNINELLGKLKGEPDNIDLILEISDKYFTMKEYENGMDLLLKNYPKNKDSIKNKMVEFFAVLGNNDQITIQYRKKLSQLMFS